jgi:hypothetical protein
MRPLWAAVLVGAGAIAATGYAVWQLQGADEGSEASEGAGSVGPCTTNPVAFIGHVQVDLEFGRLAPSVELIDHDGKCTTPEGVEIAVKIEAVSAADGSRKAWCRVTGTPGEEIEPFVPVSIRNRRTGNVEKSAVADFRVLVAGKSADSPNCLPQGRALGAYATVTVTQGGRTVTDTIPVSLPTHLAGLSGRGTWRRRCQCEKLGHREAERTGDSPRVFSLWVPSLADDWEKSVYRDPSLLRHLAEAPPSGCLPCGDSLRRGHPSICWLKSNGCQPFAEGDGKNPTDPQR